MSATMTRARGRWRALVMAPMAVVIVLAGVAIGAPVSGARPKTILAVGAENQYADVIDQIGGTAVQVHAVMSNPNTDPHEFEASPDVAGEVGSAALVVENGLGYDAFMTKILAASPSPSRKVIDVAHLLRLPDSTTNPHLWYTPKTMPAVAAAVARDLTSLDPSDATTFASNLAAFRHSLAPWQAALAHVRARHRGASVAVSEPVGDDLLQAAGVRVATPWTLQADIMNGVDPSPQAVSIEEGLLTGHRVQAFLFNRQVTDALTETFLADAHQAHVPVVGLYETMPAGYHYQSWMLAEVRALTAALSSHRSTPEL